MGKNNIENILGVSEDTNVVDSTPEESKEDSSAEETLKIIAFIILWLGIIATIISLFTVFFVKEIDLNYPYAVHHNIGFNAARLVTTICTLLGALVSWAVLNVIANISMTLKSINKKIK